MPDLNSLRPAASAAAAVLAAADLVAGDPGAAALAGAASGEVEVSSPLAEWLYRRWWMGHSAVVPEPAGGPDDPLTHVLEAARRSTAAIEEGWLVLASDGVRLVCARVRRHVGGPPELVQRSADAVVGSSRPGCVARPGDLVSMYAGSGGADAAGDWWWGHTVAPTASGEVDRWYVNVSAAGAAAVVAASVAAASDSGVPVSLKCPLRPSGFARRDAFVAYLPRHDRARWAAVLPGWLEAVAPWVGGDAPPLTRSVVPGIGFAEDPGDGASYGQLRSAQVAAAVVRWRRSPATGGDPAALLRGVGIDPERPEVVR